MTRLGGWTIEHHDRLPSTNDLAKDAARLGAPDHTVYVADEQTGGRGRGTHTWSSPRGGLYASMLLRRIPPQVAPLLALVAGVAVRRSLHTVAPRVRAWLKWPNDILVAAPTQTRPNGKLAGILVESGSSGRGVDWAVLGVGINVATRLRDLPSGLTPPAATLAEWVSPPLRPLDVLDHVLSATNDVLELAAARPGALVAEAEEHLAFRGSPVTLEPAQGDARVRGRLMGLSPTGAIRLATSTGERTVDAWDVASLRASS